MGIFAKKSVQDYAEKILRIAKQVKEDLPTVYETGNSKNIISLLRILIRFDISQFELIKEQLHSQRLMEECIFIHRLAQEALLDIENHYAFEKAIEVIDNILTLEVYLVRDFEAEIRFVPSKILGKILRYSPKEALDKGYLFRGIDDADYTRVMSGHPIFARVANGKTSLTQHILDQTNYPATPFISLTADVNAAKNFGRVIAVDVRKLQGHLYTPNEIEQLTGQDTRVKKLRRKNTEFILGPTRTTAACISSGAVVH